MTYLKNSWN